MVATRGSMINTRSSDARRSKYMSPPPPKTKPPRTPTGAAAAAKSRKRAIELDAEVVYEFGGALGAAFIIGERRVRQLYALRGR